MLTLEHLELRFGEKEVLRDCSLSLAPGGHLAVMGPSGCGKTSLLRIALGLQIPDAGSVSVSAKRAAAVFQEPRLLPWSTALENVMLVLSSPTAREDALFRLRQVELEEAAGLYPDELSGGMQQRVSLARALAVRPDFLVLDEPLKGMDEALAERMRALLLRKTEGVSLLLATHDREEAAALGCRILYYRDGQFLPAGE